MMEKKIALVFAFIIAFGLGLRLFLIETRPLHHDEGVNGHFIDQILNGNNWRYNPKNYHGPLPFYLMALAIAIFGNNVFALRLMPALFGSLMPLLLLPMRKRLGNTGFLFASFFLLFSPSLFYYSLDAIHETFFAFFILASISFLFSFAMTKNQLYLYCGIASLAFMFTTKEGSFLIAPTIFLLFLVLLNLRKGLVQTVRINVLHFLISFLLFTLIFATLFSSFFANLQGITDAFKAPFMWSEKMKAGSGHEKHALYYLELILFSDAPIFLLGLLGGFIAIKRKNFEMIAIFAFFLLLFVGMSVPAYKVPWAIINLVPMLAILSGYLVENVLKKAQNAELLYPLLAIAVVFVLSQAIMLSAFKSADRENKLAYVQTTMEAKHMVERIKSLEDEKHVKIAIINRQSVWPLPWWLKELNVKYYDAERLKSLDASTYDVLLVEAEYLYKIKNTDMFQKESFALRPGLAMKAFFKKH